MRTTIDLPDDLLQEAEACAAREGRSLKDVVTEGLRIVLETRPGEGTPRKPVSFPLVPETAHSPAITPEQVDRALAYEEAERYARFVQR